MKKIIIFISCFALCSQIILAKEIGTVVILKGDAGLVHNMNQQKIKTGSAISEGDEIETQANSYVKIVMKDRNILVVAEKSKLSINEYISGKDNKSVQMTMEYGSARHVLYQKYINTNEKYEVRTATTVAGVRGTDFLTIFNKESGDSVTCTLGGKVSLALLKNGQAEQNPILVEADHFVKVKKGDFKLQVIETDKMWLEKVLKAHSLE